MILPKTPETRLKPLELPPETDLRRDRYGPAAHKGQSSAGQSASNYPVFAALQLAELEENRAAGLQADIRLTTTGMLKSVLFRRAQMKAAFAQSAIELLDEVRYVAPSYK